MPLLTNAAAISIALGSVAAHGQPCPPAFELLRYEERYACLAGEPQTGWAGLKHIPTGARGHLTLGGTLRGRVTVVSDDVFGAARTSGDADWQQRAGAFADWRLGGGWRVFAGLFSAVETGVPGPASPRDENELALQQAFLDMPLSDATVRLGRQELAFGSQRLISVRDGDNVRARFDGVRVTAHVAGWTLDALAAFPTRIETGVFDDGVDTDRGLWGLYARRKGDGLALYYLGYREEGARFVQGRGDETRHSLGVRWRASGGGWDGEVEAIAQAGRFAGGAVRAGAVFAAAGYTADLAWSPRLALSGHAASGDGDAGDADLSAFNALFPTDTFFSQAGLFGPRNLLSLQPSITVEPAPDLRFTADLNLLWRAGLADGVYDPLGTIVRRPQGSDARFVHAAASALLSWQLNRFVLVNAAYTHAWAGGFIADTGPSQSLDFLELTLDVVF